MTQNCLTRRAALVLPVFAAACAATPDTTPLPPLVIGYSHLTPLRLNVQAVEIIPAPGGEMTRVDTPAPLRPPEEVARMGRERLFADGNTNRARFLTEQASLVRETVGQSGLFTTAPARFTCVLRCRVEVITEEGRRAAFALAEVRRTFTLGDPSPAGAIARAAETIVRQSMDDLNVELEFQARRGLREWLVAAPRATTPGEVQREDLPGGGAPGVAAPATTFAPNLTPPPNLAPNLTPNLAPPVPTLAI
ncbi:hypothetical protein ACQW02_26565 [Humitalea sp. 24SJ18S-53]|uniref:hypothetical protein n=1 Tax=Humitalea sp. 24SJ18S-53 TaxID=3422307 RepID=UPI003D6649DA